MAAHSVNILVEWAEKLRIGVDEEYRGLMIHALDRAPGCDEIKANEWLEIRNAVVGYDPESRQGLLRLKTAVLMVLGHQIEEWHRLDRPTSHEQWSQAKYGKGVEG